MSLPNNVVTWKCPARPFAVVEVLQSCPHLLEYLTNETSVEDSQRPPSSNRRLLILFPGNPGIVQFYEEFSTLMNGHRVDVLVMGLAGHTLIDLNGGRLFTLQDQIDIADQFVAMILGKTSSQKYAGSIYVAGHSIGGFIALNMLARYPAIKRFFGLCPVVSWIAASPNGRGMFFWGTPILQWVIAFLGSLFALVPAKLRARVVDSHAPTASENMRALLAKYMNRSALMNVFYMSMEEYRIVGRPDKMLLRSVQEKLFLYYVQGDKWVTPAYAQEIKDMCPRLGGFVMETDETVPHAWCLQHSGVVVENAIVKNL